MAILIISEWPGNKEKCTNLFDYCITYTEKNANITTDIINKITDAIGLSHY